MISILNASIEMIFPHFQFSSQIKSLFTFSVLTRFSLTFNFSSQIIAMIEIISVTIIIIIGVVKTIKTSNYQSYQKWSKMTNVDQNSKYLTDWFGEKYFNLILFDFVLTLLFFKYCCTSWSPLILATSANRFLSSLFSCSKISILFCIINDCFWDSNSLPLESKNFLYAKSKACPIVKVISSAWNNKRS